MLPVTISEQAAAHTFNLISLSIALVVFGWVPTGIVLEMRFTDQAIA